MWYKIILSCCFLSIYTLGHAQEVQPEKLEVKPEVIKKLMNPIPAAQQPTEVLEVKQIESVSNLQTTTINKLFIDEKLYPSDSFNILNKQLNLRENYKMEVMRTDSLNILKFTKKE